VIGSIVEATLPLMRANAESLMLDRCRIDRPSTVWSEAEQKTVTTWVEVVPEGPCSIDDSSDGRPELVTDEIATRSEPQVYLPWTVAGVRPDDRVTITALGPSTSPGLAGAVLWVSAFEVESQAVEAVAACRWLR
jgi:hypothetical protein